MRNLGVEKSFAACSIRLAVYTAQQIHNIKNRLSRSGESLCVAQALGLPSFSPYNSKLGNIEVVQVDYRGLVHA